MAAWKEAGTYALPADHREGPERCAEELPTSECEETGMKVGVRKRCTDGLNELTCEAEANEAKGDVDKVGSTKRLDREREGAAIGPKLVVLLDDEVDLLPERIQTTRRQIVVGEDRGRGKVVEGAGGPDTEVVECGGDENRLLRSAELGRYGEEELENTSDVVPIPRKVRTQRLLVGGQDVID